MLTLYTASTPNGHKVSVTLEELGLDYEVRHVRIMDGEQKEPWFRALNPNARIPVIVDHDASDHVLFESGAILLYLAEKSGRLLGADPLERSHVIQWLMFQMGGVGPMMGQANVFFRYADEKIPYAIDRYQRESRRLFEVLETRLRDHEWLTESYSIADIANFCWVRTHKWSGVSIEGLPGLHAWLKRIRARPAVERGLCVPAKVTVKPEDEARFAEEARRILV